MLGRKKIGLLFFGLILSGVFVALGLFSLKATYTIQRVVTPDTPQAYSQPSDLPLSEEIFKPQPEPERIDFLLLGIRGEDDPWGGLLTDAIMLASLDKNTGKTALISIPRDLYVPISVNGKRNKINAAYAEGFSQGGVAGGISAAKETVANVCGIYVDYAAVINFDAFQEFIDALGGITIYRDEPFVESHQWWCDEEGKNCRVFSLPAGENNLDGTTTLFYIRSRKSSNDFDRARRQQQVLFAVEKKLLSLGVLANPLRWLALLDVIGDNLRTDIPPRAVLDLINQARQNRIDLKNVATFVFDTSAQGLLKADTLEDGTYILLPREEDFDSIRDVCKNILE